MLLVEEIIKNDQKFVLKIIVVSYTSLFGPLIV